MLRRGLLLNLRSFSIMPIPPTLSSEHVIQMAHDLMATKMFSLSSCVILFYDMALTMGEEIEYIWSRKFSFFTLLWLFNRYLTLIGSVVLIVSFHDPWSKQVCDRYILFPEAFKVVTSLVIGLVFIGRAYVMYARRMDIAVIGAILLAAELAVKIWAFTDGVSLDMPQGIVGCILVGKNDNRFVFTWIAELIFDSIMFFMTFWRTFRQSLSLNSRFKGMTLVNLMFRDGIIYFGVISIVNLVTVLMFLVAKPNLKAFTATLSTLITSVMVSRLILNLRKAVDHGGIRDVQEGWARRNVSTSQFM